MIYIDNGKIKNTDDLEVLGTGLEGVTYSDGKSAIKIYNNPEKVYLEEKDCEFFTTLETQAILLPRQIIYDLNKKYIGYKKQLIEDVLPAIGVLEYLNFDEEERRIYDDLELLSKNGVKLEDLDTNCLYNGNLYFTDPGSLIQVKTTTNLKKINLQEVNLAIHNYVMLVGNSPSDFEDDFCSAINKNCTLSEGFRDFVGRIYIDNYYSRAFDYNNIFDYLRGVLYDYGSLEEYKRTILEEACDNYQYAGCSEADELRRILGRQ